MYSQELFNLLLKENLNFITGVPCSIFKDFLIFINENSDKINHIGATSEGEAVALAAGYHLATNKVPIIYMQNSGLGNSVNPLTSLMDKEVYSIPAVLFISWRGEPGKPDEPQHAKMGKIIKELLKVLDIPFEIASEDLEEFSDQLQKLKDKANLERRPVVLIFKKGIIVKGKSKKYEESFLPKREEALEIVLEKIGQSPVISTTGKTSREIFEIREKNKESHNNDFLIVGSMGGCSAISLGVSLYSDKKIFAIDGDGAVLMKMGNLATIGKYHSENFIHIVIDNASHESTGGQPTSSPVLDWEKLFMATGYKKVIVVDSLDAISDIDFDFLVGPAAVVLKCQSGSRADLGRPTIKPVEAKNNFMNFLKK